ncbi:hypothetical protein AXG93_1913s1500 [Marchantia polymorpha subsp. ruderalis]|uniref:Uncharacterized protein n=1 Tax=Marchantia polymorpha subsp. ruderalis TaxID=1480154 RepID=A0A176WIK5_MARPO|nr:hypothetical protein AXG93_1913s1500 [Marchantia polymorpha subsp. ruderalis]
MATPGRPALRTAGAQTSGTSRRSEGETGPKSGARESKRREIERIAKRKERNCGGGAGGGRDRGRPGAQKGTMRRAYSHVQQEARGSVLYRTGAALLRSVPRAAFAAGSARGAEHPSPSNRDGLRARGEGGQRKLQNLVPRSATPFSRGIATARWFKVGRRRGGGVAGQEEGIYCAENSKKRQHKTCALGR